MSNKVPSVYQQAIYKTVTETAYNLIIVAVAGSGKSTTLKHVFGLLRGYSVILAFNAAIAKELKEAGLKAMTFHSLCMRTVLDFKGLSSPDDVTGNKLQKLVKGTFNADDAHNYGPFVCKLVSLARNAGVECEGLMPNVPNAWQTLIDRHDLELPNDSCTNARAIELAQFLLKESNESPMIDWDDILYLPILKNLTLRRYNNVLVDEAQDTNAIQRAILRKILTGFNGKMTGRLIAVGDPAQAIYGFRGADSDSLELIANEFKCVEMPLSISYRCAPRVVEYARQWVSHIEANPAREDIGGVAELGEDWLLEDFEQNDLVVCRTTRPLITLAMRMLKARIPVRIMGRDSVGKQLIEFIESMEAWTIDELETKLAAYREREVKKALEKNDEGKVEAICDRIDAIRALMSGLGENNRTVKALIDVLKDLFNEAKVATTLATIHKSKGLEARTVYWLNRSQCPSVYARQPWQLKQEDNLCYVAATRAKVSLRMIEEGTRN